VPLIVNADDFGLTPGVNRSVAELHRAGALSSATLMATGAFFDDALALARANPNLEIGCHILLVDGTPALAPRDIPSLCPNGHSFRPTLSRFLRDLFSRRIHHDEIIAEACAQIRRLQRAGLHVSHIDTHKHTHLFSGVLRPLLNAACACGVPAIRNPFEPAWSLRATKGTSRLRRLSVIALKSRHRAFQRAIRAAGLATTSGTIGVLSTGTRNVAETLRSLLAALPKPPPIQSGAASPVPTFELVCHPGYLDAHLDQVKTRLRSSRAREHAALLQLLPGTQFASWGDLSVTHAGDPTR
jgi:chitin disaccharide deacetylase